MSSYRFDEDIWFLERVSSGINYELHLAFWPEENDKVLVKLVRDDIDPDKKAEVEERLLKEAATLEEFWSPYFPKVYDIRRKDDGTLYLIIQFFPGVSLREYINLNLDKKTVSIHFINNFISEMDYALSYLHNKKSIVHADISPDNIIITPDNKVRLIDFEDSRQMGTPLESEKFRGKLNYLSPEVKMSLDSEMKELEAKTRWDLYAYGVTLEELCQATSGLDRIKALLLRKKVIHLKKQRSFKLSLPSFKLPKKALIATGALIFLLFILSLATDEKTSQSPKKVVVKQEVIEKQSSVLKKKYIPKKVVKPKVVTAKPKKKVAKKSTNSKVKKPIARSPSLPPMPKRKKAILTKNIPTAKSIKSFKERFEKLLSQKDPYLQECMSYESNDLNNHIALTFHLSQKKGRAKNITFNNDDNLNQLTKSCLRSLYTDIVFPQHPSKKEVQIVQSFTFSNQEGDLYE